MNEQERPPFEAWFDRQFPDAVDGSLDRNDVDGYATELVNAMWVGFCARSFMRPIRSDGG
jgi:hypothetical protein